MTDKEINKAVARKLGWSEIQGTIGRPPGTADMLVDIPDYCHSISAAWEIVEKIRQTELISLCWHDGYWHCEINCVDGNRPIDIESDTFPMAIVLAFLKLEDEE